MKSGLVSGLREEKESCAFTHMHCTLGELRGILVTVSEGEKEDFNFPPFILKHFITTRKLTETPIPVSQSSRGLLRDCDGKAVGPSIVALSLSSPAALEVTHSWDLCESL